MTEFTKEGCKGLAAAVIRRTFEDLVRYDTYKRKQLERQILDGSIDLYLGLLNAALTPEMLIQKAKEVREGKPKKRKGQK